MRIGLLFATAWMALLPSLALAERHCYFNGEQPICEDVVTNQVPEPETLVLLGVGAVAMLVARRRKR